MARKKKKPKTLLFCGCGHVSQKDERFSKGSVGALCECTERERDTGSFLKTKKGLKQLTFSSISITQSADTLERVE